MADLEADADPFDRRDARPDGASGVAGRRYPTTAPPGMATTLRSATFQAAFYLWTTLLATAMLPAAPFVSAARMRRFAAFWMRGTQLLLWLICGIRHEVRGLANLPPGPVIIAAKHQSAWETLFFHTVRPDIVIGLKQELGRIPVFGWYLAIGGNIFIDRGGAARALRSLITGAGEAAAKGCSLLIFPEGTRTRPGAAPDYKSGVAALYAALGVPVVPVALASGRFWGPGSRGKRPGVIRVAFLPAIAPGLDRRRFMAELEAAIEGTMPLLEAEAVASIEAAGRRP